MNRVYIMVVESLYDDSRKQFKSLRQGATPPGYRLVGVCGFFDSPKSRKELKEELYHGNRVG